MKNIYWVGTRQSDIEDTGDFFKGSVTIFGDNQNGNIAYCTNNQRINHNIENIDCHLFFKTTLESLCEEDENVSFMFYNPALAYQYGEIIKQHTVCLNEYEILDAFSNKQRSRFLITNIIDTIPYVILKGDECYYKNICNYFVGYDEFVVQKVFSSGGEGTYRINSLSNFNFIDFEEEYLISPYIEDAISLNTHIIIFEKDILFFPSSVQIITEIDNKLLYSGGDFICYNTIPKNIQLQIKEKIECIGHYIRKKGYKGILGIDFILKNQNLYFMEFNTRFQASSQLINKALHDYGEISLHEINLQAFEDDKIANIKPFNVNYSNYIYSTSNISIERLRRISMSKEILHIQYDGYNVSNTNCVKGKNIYLNRCIFNRNICSLSNGKLVLHPNIYVENLKAILTTQNPHYKEHIKFALLNHGVSLSKDAIQLAMKYGTIKEAVFDAIDTVIFDKVNVNIPCTCKFNSLSPFTIEAINDKFILFFDNNVISDIEIYFVPDSLLNKFTKSGVPYDTIINLATDRIRINPAPVCYYKQHKLACKFCNLPDHNISYNLSDIKEVIDYCLSSVEFRHFLIGGGTYSTNETGWTITAEIAKYIREKCDKDIYLMSIPPKNCNVLDNLKVSGITEVAFNLEIFDRKMARDYMPGKGALSIEQYMSALTYAVSLWGNTGCVRSLLIYGFDSDNVFLHGIEELCKYGIEPIISVFRPLNGTAFEELNPPPTEDIISIYEKCKKIAEKYSLILGPDCPMCQNNTLSFS